LIGIIVGYVNFGAIGEASWIQLPKFMNYGLQFDIPAIISMIVIYIVNSVQAVGDYSATTEGGLDRETTDTELSGGIMANGLTSILGSFIGGFLQ